MQTEQRPYVSDFIKYIMPAATERDQLDAQRDLDGALDVIDRIEARLFREKAERAARDKIAVSDSYEGITSDRNNPIDST